MDQHKSEILKIFNNIEQDDEFEIMFNNYKNNNKLLINDFINVMKYVKFRSEKDKLELKTSFELNIQYSIDSENVYRFIINKEENINNFLELVHFKKKHNMIAILVNQFIDKDNYSLIKKIKIKQNILDIDELDIRVRKSKEIDVSSSEKKELSNLNPSDQHNIIFRLKQRLSLVLDKDLHIDLTIIKMSNEIKQLNNVNKQYELEIDYSPIKPNKLMLAKILKETENVKKVMSQSDTLLSNSQKISIIEKYKILMFRNNNSNITNLYSMQPINAEVPHFIDNIPNKYSVTDKADGDKYILYIIDGNLYLISNNLNIKYISSNHKLKETVLEGEYIYLSSKKKYVLMIYDCLYFDGQDIRDEPILKKRFDVGNVSVVTSGAPLRRAVLSPTSSSTSTRGSIYGG